MSTEFIKIPLRDIHRFGLDGMLQAYSGNCKHLQNRSPSSLHGKQHKLTKSQGVVLYFYNASLGQYKEVNNMCRSPYFQIRAMETFQTFQHEMLPSFRSVWRLLQTKGPSGSRLNSSTVSMAKIRAAVAGRQFQPECYCYRDRTATCCVWTWNRTGVVRS